MQNVHAMLIGVRRGEVILDDELIATTDRASAGLLVRIAPRAVIGFPEPPKDFVHDGDEWLLIAGMAKIHLAQMRALKFETVRPLPGDVFFNGFQPPPPAPRRVAWIAIAARGFRLAR